MLRRRELNSCVRLAVVAGVVTCGVARSAYATSYTTTFPLTEDPDFGREDCGSTVASSVSIAGTARRPMGSFKAAKTMAADLQRLDGAAVGELGHRPESERHPNVESVS